MRDHRPITFDVVCALARNVILLRPHFTDTDWKEAVKIVALKQGWTSPSTEMLSRALGNVERSMAQTVGLRRDAAGRIPVLPPPRSDDRVWTAGDYRALALTLKSIALRTAASRQLPVPRIVRETWDIDEAAALDQFYAEAHAGDRLGTLRRFAEIAIVRPPDWDYRAVREEAARHALSASACYGCRLAVTPLHWHHVIQIQHGGSNYLRNRTALCPICHGKVHPWLVPETRGTWHSFADVAAACREFIRDRHIIRKDAS